MFQKGACIFSPAFGHGQVIASGDPPLVRLLGGDELYIAADRLRPIPTDEFEALLARQTRFEHAWARRVWGCLADLKPLWVRDEEGLWITPERLEEQRRRRPGPIQYFLPDDLGEQVRALGPGECREDAVACGVRRVPHGA